MKVKTKGIERWHVEWDNRLRRYDVIKEGFRESTHLVLAEAFTRIEELEALEEEPPK